MYSSTYAFHHTLSASKFSYRSTTCLNWFTIPITLPEFWLYTSGDFSSKILKLQIEVLPIISNREFFTCIQLYKNSNSQPFQYTSQHTTPPPIVYEFTPSWVDRQTTAIPGRMLITTGDRVELIPALNNIEIGVTRKIDPTNDVHIRLNKYITVANF
ncbi:hypothetical protein CcNV_095 [Crangon crangon nudivirus]|uniref:Uncharacterized protein n=1 Tax=Crangon crangon nudivirus TaxID=2880838 RepID=A0AAE8Y0B2_9VIRU|nr:hypothetical protein QKT25_gp096 [Crangon crangon nudivirus]UBZ25580.1 hypothetical protein CcNV_095 [Crangon crangon nudivirus]